MAGRDDKDMGSGLGFIKDMRNRFDDANTLALMALGGITCIALGLRLWPLSATWLWSDEIFSVSLAEAGLYKALLGTFRHDLHPPVYYLQLVPWAGLFRSDAGMVLNSVLWDLARLVATIVGLYRIAGINAALVGGFAGAFLGSTLYNAENLRMYAMMGFAIIVAWALTEKMFERTAKQSWRDALVLLAMQILIVGSHGAGPFFVFFVPLHGLVLWMQIRGGRRDRLPWLTAQILTGLAGLLVIINGMPRATEHYQIEWTWQEILLPPGFMSAGITLPYSGPTGILISSAITFAIILLGLSTRAARLTTLIYVVAPIVLALVLSASVKPIYGFRTMICAAVFLPVVLGLSFAEQRRAGSLAGQGLVGLCLLGIVAFGLHQRVFYQKDHDYPALAAYLRDVLQPGDVILQSRQPATAWALGRYLVGPGWGDILKVQHPINEKWERLFARLGPDVARAFAAETDRMTYDGTIIGLGEPAANELVPQARRAWVVATFVYDSDAAPQALRAQDPAGCSEFRGVFLCRYDLQTFQP